MEAMVKFVKGIKAIVQIMYLHWVGECFGDYMGYLRKLVLPKVTRKEKRSSASIRKTLGKS